MRKEHKKRDNDKREGGIIEDFLAVMLGVGIILFILVVTSGVVEFIRTMIGWFRK
jgi:hypothetical protein